MKLLFIINPTAGNGRAIRIGRMLADAVKSRGIHGAIRVTERPGHGEELAAEAAAQSWDGVVAVGGDGTVHEAVNGLAESDVPLGIIPVGTGNDFARALGIPRQPLPALDVIVAGHVRSVDLGEVNGRRYVQVAGVGFDAEVAAAVTRNRARMPGGGALPYLWGILHKMATYKNQRLTLETEGGTVEREALMVAIGNTRNYAGGLMICPDAQLDDGLLDMCLIGNLSHWQRVNVLARVFSGGHVRHPKVSYGKTPWLNIDGPSNLLVQADGQIIGNLPARVRVLPLAGRVFAPAQSSST